MKERKITDWYLPYSQMVDRISSLPDSILIHILSFLSTKNAVATGILSQRWKFIWTMVLDLHFEFKLILVDFDKATRDHNGNVCWDTINKQSEEKSMRFVQFVYKVLSLRKVGTINNFSLFWSYNCVPCHVIAWINTAIDCNVQEIFVHVKDCKSILEIPHGIFSCERLKSLELNCGLDISAAIVVCLPRLETLKLARVCFECEEAFQKLINGCPLLKSLELNCDDICISAAILISLPMLETMKLHSISFKCDEAFQCLISGCPVLKYLHISKEITKDMESISNAFTFMVSSTSLRHLELHISCKNYPVPYCSLELEAPSLQFLKVHDCISRIFIRGNMNSLIEANFNILSYGWDNKPLDETYSSSIVEAVRAFNCAKSITLSKYVMRALGSAKIKLCTKFKRLKKLTVTADGGFWSPLQEFIQCSDVLEVVTFKKGSGYTSVWNQACWKSLEQVPVCLSNSLKLVSFPSFEGFPDEIAMVGYILNHGSVLQAVDIESNTYKRSKEGDLQMLREISMFSRKSPDCELNFH